MFPSLAFLVSSQRYLNVLKKNQSPNKVFSVSLNKVKNEEFSILQPYHLMYKFTKNGTQVQEKSSVFPNPYRP